MAPGAEEHVVIRDAIAANDPDAAKAAMQRHLSQSQKRFSQSFGRRLEGGRCRLVYPRGRE